MRNLVAEDDRVTSTLLESNLRKWGYDLIICSEGGEAWRVLQTADAPKLVILDWMMPGMTGVEICKKVRKLNGLQYIYIILLTSKGRKDDFVEGLEAGADDYVVKPFDPNELRVRVRASARVIQLQEDLRSALDFCEFRASHDTLTSLWNRSAILDLLETELARSTRERTSLGVILADVDNFKRINDQYGHLAGDALLRGLSKRMQSLMRRYDSVGRYGGEEFLIVIPGCDLENTRQAAERLRAEFADNCLTTPEGVFSITLSFGLVTVQAGESEDLESIVRRADQALYKAKEIGRNRVCVSRESS